MRATFFAIYIWVQLQSLVQGLNSENTTENEAQDSGRRILFGKAAAESDFPYLVKLNIEGDDIFCGGSIIADQWILSATHCIINANCDVIKIHPAVWERQRVVNAIECHAHPQFEPYRLTYDISLLKTKENLVADGIAKIIPMPSPGTRFAAGTPAITVGWGQTEKKTFSSELLFANIKVKDWETCNKAVLASACKGIPDCGFPNIAKRFVCTVGEGSNPPAICGGDSGGPVVIDGKLAGVAASVLVDEARECYAGAHGMFTSVVDYLPWILSYVTPEADTSKIQVQPED